ncbi:MAG: hypothetical protein AAFU85_06680 [Planctomycetota bacterium]
MTGLRFFLGMLVCFSCHTSRGETVVDLGTPDNAANWLITAAGAVDAVSFQANVNRPGTISLMDNGLVTGNFVAGAMADDYNGFWFAENTFFIPDAATDVQLNFDGLWANDRVVLTLNGVELGNATFAGGTGAGLMRFEEDGADLPFTFTETNSGTVTSGFNIGGDNVLRLTVNNTGVNLAAPTVASAFAGDATAANLATATLTFTAIPEPSSCLVLFACGTLVLTHRRR